MIGSLLTRGMTLVLGYLYPAYECFKTVEKNRPDLEHLRFWCEYWMIIALVTVLERVGGDALISWLPLYSEAKLAFIVYLWYPSTRGTTYVYATFVRPFVARYEQEIDGNLGELRVRAGDIAYYYWQRSSTFFQGRFVELLQFLASQSPRAPYAPPVAQNVYPPPRLPGGGGRLQPGGGSGGYQPSAPQPPPGYSGVGQAAPYPPPGAAGLGRPGAQRPNAPPPPPGYPGPPRTRSVTEDDDEFELVDNNMEPNAPPYPPDDPAGLGYMTRARQRALGDRGRAPGGAAPGNLYYTGSGPSK